MCRRTARGVGKLIRFKLAARQRFSLMMAWTLVWGGLLLCLTDAQALPSVTSPIIVSSITVLTQGALAGTQADAPVSAYPGGAYWLGSHFDYAVGQISHVLTTGTMDDPHNQVAWVKLTCNRLPSNYCGNAEVGMFPAFTSFAAGLTDVVNLWFVDLYWPGGAGEVLAFIHEENAGNTFGGNVGKTRLGLAWSTDSGNTWKYLGRIVSAYSDPEGFNIQGAPYIVKDGYFQVYYPDISSDGVTWGIGVSRADIASVIAAARAGNVGNNLWNKYYNGAWTEPSLGGRPSFPTNQWDVTHTQAVHSRYTGKYYMPLTRMNWMNNSTRVILYESVDGLSWTPSITLVDEPNTSHLPSSGYQYCSLVDANGTANHEVGRTFYGYCFHYSNSTPGTKYGYVRWTVDLDGAANTYRQSVDFSSTQGPRWFYQYGAPLANMSWTGNGYWVGGDEFDRIHASSMHPGVAEDPVLAWVAPQAGIVEINGTVHDADPTCGDGVRAQIVHNAQVLFAQTVSNGDTVGESVRLTRHVDAGDSLSFMIGPNGSNFCDTTFWDPSIQYVSIDVANVCDVNGNGGVDVTDLQLAVRQAIGLDACSADINQDQQCNIIDVQRVVNAALGGACVSP